MNELGNAVAVAARELAGVRFRPQGRDPAFGLDCVGLVVAALARVGIRIEARRDYPQRGGDPAAVAGLIDDAGLRRIASTAAGSGDIVLVEAGPAQLHLAVLTSGGFVHADAGLRRVVEVPGRPVWPVIGAWRIDPGAR